VRNHRRRWRPLRAVLSGLAAITLAAGTMAATASTASSSPQGPAASDDKIRPKLLDQLESKDSVDFWIYFEAKADLSKAGSLKDWDERGTAVARELRQTADSSQAAVQRELDRAGIKYQSFWVTNAIKVSDGDLQLAEQVASNAEVDSLWASFKVEVPETTKGENAHEINAVEWGIANINADDVWDQYGVRGEGITVASIDTGVQYDHPALVGKYRGNNGDSTFDHNYNWFDAAGNCASAPCDLNGHGTHTMGTMIGDDGAGNQIGVAPEATWIAANGCCPNDAALIASGEWLLEPTDLNGDNPDASKRPNIINNSWGSTLPSTAPFMEDISIAWEESGIFGVWANGNSGEFGCNSSGSPGSRIINYSVGAYDINNNPASFSGRGAGQDGEIKPNLAAPGVNVRSSVPGDNYQNFNGTSMATPHVAGTIALLWSAAPSLVGDVAATKGLLDGTAVDRPDNRCGGTDDDNNVFGEGRLDALALLNAAPIGDTGTLAGTVTDAGTGDPISGAELSITGAVDRDVTTGADGTYSVLLPTGDYEVVAGAFGYAEQTVTATITADQTTTQDFALEGLPTVTVGGTVTDGSGHGWPLYAKVSVAGPGGASTYTNPADGRYSFELPAGSTYTLTIEPQYDGYQTVTEDVEVGSGNVTRNVAVPVDPSCTAPGYEFSEVSPVLEEGFDSGATPAGWTVVDHQGNGQVWTFNDPGGRGNLTGGSGGFAIVDSDEYGPGQQQDTSLVTPVIDLTDVPSPVIGFQQDHNQLGDLADVDVSLDGGATWENLHSQSTDVRGPRQDIVNAPQAGGESAVQFRFHYHQAAFSWWWQVDDVFVGNRTCDPVNAGLVVGQVRDANTDSGIVGATVTSDDNPAETATTIATPDDAELGDGFWWIVSSLTGEHPFSAAAENYGSDSTDVDVEADWVTEADFVLDAGMLSVDRESIEVTTPMDRVVTRTFNVTNDGTAPATVELAGGGGGFEMLGGGGGASTSLRYTDEVSEAANAAAARPQAVTSAKSDGFGRAPGAGEKPAQSRTPAMPKTPADEVTITHSVSQEIIQFNSVSCNSGAGNAENGFLRTFELEDFGITSDFNVTSVSFGVESATATQPISVKLYTLDGEFVYDNMTLIGSTDTTLEAQELSMVTVPVTGTAPAGSNLVVELDSPNLQNIGAFFFPGSNDLGQTAPTYLRSETCGLAEPTPTDEVGFPDMHLVMNVTGEAGSSVPWMTVTPETMTLDPGESARVRVTMNSDVEQPGAYTGRVNLSNDTPYDVEPVAVTMNVTPPGSWGKVIGTVTGTDCDGASSPLEGATVQFDWWSGDLTLFTDANGEYAYWLDSRGNPYSVIVAKDGYKPKAHTQRIQRGETVTRNVVLQEAGC
jgi:subtilisin family serine protease